MRNLACSFLTGSPSPPLQLWLAETFVSNCGSRCGSYLLLLPFQKGAVPAWAWVWAWTNLQRVRGGSYGWILNLIIMTARHAKATMPRRVAWRCCQMVDCVSCFSLFRLLLLLLLNFCCCYWVVVVVSALLYVCCVVLFCFVSCLKIVIILK